MKTYLNHNFARPFIAVLLAFITTAVAAVPVHWTDWTGWTGSGGFRSAASLETCWRKGWESLKATISIARRRKRLTRSRTLERGAPSP